MLNKKQFPYGLMRQNSQIGNYFEFITFDTVNG